MLQQFNFENYSSFRDQVSLDFCATKITEFEDTIVKEGNEKILPAIAIYGANASGKSNVLNAFFHMCYYIMNSASYLIGNNNEQSAESDTHTGLNVKNYAIPFKFDSKSAEKPSTFEVFYTDENEKTINYGFSADKNGIVEEWLFITSKSRRSKPKQIINRIRNKNIIEINGIIKANKENLLVALKPHTLILSLGYILNIELLKNIFNWFASVKFVDYGNILNLINISFKAPEKLPEDEQLQKRISKYLSSFDKSIVNIKATRNPNNANGIKIETLHKMIDSEDLSTLLMSEESDGTQKMFSLFSSIDSILNNGSILVIDELNARLHPLLVRNLLKLFIDPSTNPKHAQILFTCHDSWLLSSNILRRDEIWFTEKNVNGISNLYSLADFVDDEGYKIRKDSNFEKNYLIGKYGAIPTLESLDMFIERPKFEGAKNYEQ